MPQTVLRSADGSQIVTRSKTKKFKCPICAKLSLVIDHQYKNPELEARLCSITEFFGPTKCTVHPRLLSYYALSRSRTKGFIIVSAAKNFIFLHTNLEGPDRFGGWFRDISYKSPYSDDGFKLGRAIGENWIANGLPRRWKRSCDAQQNKSCQQPITHGRLHGSAPIWLIDTWLMRLVPGKSYMSYVALSYVWGQTPFFKTSTQNLAMLQNEHALRQIHEQSGLPKTVFDATKLTQLLEERYLWVDALCVVQDDVEMKMKEILNMGYIYASATVTIVAKDGVDAEHGLRGVRGLTHARNISQRLYPISKAHTLSDRQTYNDGDCVWDGRGWTFQENMLARRALIFDRKGIFWRCPCSHFTEDCKVMPGQKADELHTYMFHSLFESRLPDLVIYRAFAQTYNTKSLTNPEDIFAAFAGITATLASTFCYGFVYGLPVMFLHQALCWQPSTSDLMLPHNTPCIRRKPRHDSKANRASLPSWSWMGWNTSILRETSWSDAHFALRFRTSSSVRFFSDIKWHVRSIDSLDQRYLKGPQALQKVWHEAQNVDYPLPKGWKRVEYEHKHPRFLDTTINSKFQWDCPDIVPPKFVFEHESQPRQFFWKPIPTCEDLPEPAILTADDHLLCCKTQRVFFSFNKDPDDKKLRNSRCHCDPTHTLVARNHPWAGIIQLNGESIIDPEKDIAIDGMVSCELVMISEGSAIEGRDEAFCLPEWNLEDRPRGPNGTLYEYYNVLWVELDDGIAYRKGCGRVLKEAWESNKPEWIDLTLG